MKFGYQTPEHFPSQQEQSGRCRAIFAITRYCLLYYLKVVNIQGEHKVFPWLQTFITKKLREIQTYFLPLFKLVSKILSCVHCNIRFLDVTFPNRWIGRDGPTPWPPRSPDITLLDFFLWRYVKDKVFSTPVPDITNLKARITDAFATVTEDMLENTRKETDYRLDVIRATKLVHVEVYYVL